MFTAALALLAIGLYAWLAGELHLDMALWPEDGLRITARGYEPLKWDPSEGYAELEAAFVWLERP